MPTTLTRELYDSRYVRTLGAQLRRIDLSTSLAGRFEETLGDLAFTQAERFLADRDRYTDEQRREMAITSREKEFEARYLRHELAFTAPDTPEAKTLTDRLAQLEVNYSQFLTEQDQISIEQGRLRTPEQLTDQYGDLGLTFDRPMTQGEADILARNKKAEQIRQALIEVGPQGVLPTAAQFGAGILAAATDPLELGIAFIPFVGQAPKIAALAKLGTVGQKMATGAANGFVGSVVTEPGYYLLSKSQQLDYTMTDALFNVGVGTALGGGIGTIAGLFARSRSKNIPTEGEIEVENPVTPIPDEPFTESYFFPAPKSISGERIDVVPEPKIIPRAELESQMQSAQLAITQFASGNDVDVSFTITPVPKRPMTTSEFVALKGGVRLDGKNAGSMVVYDLDSGVTPKRMAQLAKRAGFITTASEKKLADALADEGEGQFIFSNKPRAQKELRDWRAYWKDQETDQEKTLKEREVIEDELQKYGFVEFDIDTISRISSAMAQRDLTLDQAAKELDIDLEGAKSKIIAQQYLDGRNKPMGEDAEAYQRMEDEPTTIEVPEERIDGVRPERRGDRRGRDQARIVAASKDEISSRQPLKGAPIREGATGPDIGLNTVAEQYAADNGIRLTRQAEYVKVDKDRARRIAQAFEEMEDAPTDPVVQEAYRDLIQQTRAQYDALIKAGYKFTFFDSKTDPYGGNPYNAMRDLRNNKQMAVYGTYDGYGTLDDFAADLKDPNRIMLQDSGLRWVDQAGKEQIVTNNDLFRAVHDAFGHGLEGAGFRARGEENAWQAHAKLFRGPALRALTTETRGQNSWLNYGPYGAKNRTAGVLDTVFADQKMGLMPEFTWQEGLDIVPEEPVRPLKTTPDTDFSEYNIDSLDRDLIEQQRIIDDYRATGDLSQEDIDSFAELDQFDQYAQDYDDISQVAASCVARS